MPCDRERGFELSAEFNILAMITWGVAVCAFGALADRTGSLVRIVLTGSVAVGLLAPLAFFLVDHLPAGACTPLLLLLTVCHAAYVGPVQAWFVLSLRRVHSRNAGLGLAYNLCAALLAGTTPLIAHALSGTPLGATGSGSYLSLAALLSGMTVLLAERHVPIMASVNATSVIGEGTSRSDAPEHHPEASSSTRAHNDAASSPRAGPVETEMVL
eukprot:7139962-Prymnesium_polylepis.2